MATPLTTLRRFWDRIGDRDLDGAVALLDPVGKFWSRPIGTVPMEAFVYIMRAVQTAAPMRMDVRTAMESGNRAVLEMDGFGTFPAGEPYTNSYVFIADVRDGLIAHLREYNDSAYSNDIFARNLPAEVLQTFGQMVAAAHATP
jgi:ketosteroid isomerase-like protein